MSIASGRNKRSRPRRSGEVAFAKNIYGNRQSAAIARHQGETIGCPITTGIFAWIAAHAAAEAAALGKGRSTPWWRALKSNGELNPKYPGGVKEQATRLRAEGHKIVPGRGTKPPKVADYEHRLAAFAGT